MVVMFRQKRNLNEIEVYRLINYKSVILTRRDINQPEI